jgi:hypothetical protein
MSSEDRRRIEFPDRLAPAHAFDPDGSLTGSGYRGKLDGAKMEPPSDIPTGAVKDNGSDTPVKKSSNERRVESRWPWKSKGEK